MGRFVYWVEETGYFIMLNWLEAGYLGQRLEGVVLRMKVILFIKGIRMQCEGSATEIADCQRRPDQPTDWNQCWI